MSNKPQGDNRDPISDERNVATEENMSDNPDLAVLKKAMTDAGIAVHQTRRTDRNEGIHPTVVLWEIIQHFSGILYRRPRP